MMYEGQIIMFVCGVTAGVIGTLVFAAFYVASRKY
jgi:hypothetical protein